jgi:hypothetical protein
MARYDRVLNSSIHGRLPKRSTLLLQFRQFVIAVALIRSSVFRISQVLLTTLLVLTHASRDVTKRFRLAVHIALTELTEARSVSSVSVTPHTSVKPED